MVSNILTSGSALLLDVLCTAIAITYPLSLGGMVGLVAARVVVAALAAAAAQLHAPPSAVRDRRGFFALCWALAFFVPVIGAVGVQVLSLFGLRGKHADAGDPWTTLDVDDEMADAPVATKRPTVSRARIASLLSRRAPEDADRRFQAILLVKHLPPNQQVPLLKLALKDASDEVRLFAFSRIEKFRSDLEAKVKQFTLGLETTAEPGARLLLHLRLAETFHEIAYLQLAEGAVLDHALNEAHRHALEAGQLAPASGPTEYLLGRILLRMGDYEGAVAALQMAAELHYPRTKVLPYLAECAFRQKQYGRVRKALAEMERVTRGTSVLQPLVDFWR